MSNDSNPKSYVIDKDSLPVHFPTHRHDPKFWEALGRTVATYGFLEEALGKAIFSFTATRPYPESEIEDAYSKWLPILEKALFQSLGNRKGGLIKSYNKSVREHPKAANEHLNEQIEMLCKESEVRTVLCHGSWRSPDAAGRSIPLFVSSQKLLFTTPIDISYLQETQMRVARLACDVLSSISEMGWQIPGSKGVGKVIW